MREKIVREHYAHHPASPDKGEELERAKARPPGKPPGRYLGSVYWLIAKSRNNRTKMLTVSRSATGNAADLRFGEAAETFVRREAASDG